MSKWISEEEMERIARFAESPGYTQNPSMLLPEEQDDDEDETE